MTISALILAGMLSGQANVPAAGFNASSRSRFSQSAEAPTGQNAGVPTPAAAAATSRPPQSSSVGGVLQKYGIGTRTSDGSSDVRGDIQPITAEPALTPVPSAKSESGKLLSGTLAAIRSQLPQGKSVALKDVISPHVERGRQLLIVQRYWELSVLLADLHFAQDELSRLQRLPGSTAKLENDRRKAAKDAAQARLSEAETAVVTAQYALVEATGSSIDASLLLPADDPFVGNYRTQYETLFANRAAPAGLLRIHRTLPLRHDLIHARADAVASARSFCDTVGQAFAAGQASGSELIEAVNNLRQQRGALLGAVRDYNLDIAEYAFAVASPADPAEKVVGMLIEVSGQDLDGGFKSVLVTPPQGRPQSPTPAVGSPTVIPVGSNAPVLAPQVVPQPTGTPSPVIGGNRITVESANPLNPTPAGSGFVPANPPAAVQPPVVRP